MPDIWSIYGGLCWFPHRTPPGSKYTSMKLAAIHACNLFWRLNSFLFCWFIFGNSLSHKCLNCGDCKPNQTWMGFLLLGWDFCFLAGNPASWQVILLLGWESCYLVGTPNTWLGLLLLKWNPCHMAMTLFTCLIFLLLGLDSCFLANTISTWMGMKLLVWDYLFLAGFPATWLGLFQLD